MENFHVQTICRWSDSLCTVLPRLYPITLGTVCVSTLPCVLCMRSRLLDSCLTLTYIARSSLPHDVRADSNIPAFTRTPRRLLLLTYYQHFIFYYINDIFAYFTQIDGFVSYCFLLFFIFYRRCLPEINWFSWLIAGSINFIDQSIYWLTDWQQTGGDWKCRTGKWRTIEKQGGGKCRTGIWRTK